MHYILDALANEIRIALLASHPSAILDLVRTDPVDLNDLSQIARNMGAALKIADENYPLRCRIDHSVEVHDTGTQASIHVLKSPSLEFNHSPVPM